MNKKEAEKVLGLVGNYDKDMIKSKYRKLSIKWHPDKNSSQFSNDIFDKINQAYRCLIESKKKKKNFQYQEEIEIYVIGKYTGILNNCRADQIVKMNLINKLRLSMISEQEELKRQIIKLYEGLGITNDILGRFNKSADLLRIFMKDQLNKIKTEIKSCSVQLILVTKAIKFIRDYKFYFDSESNNKYY